MITKFVREAAAQMRENPSVGLFISLRYDQMSRICPHEPFSSDQVSLNFFEDTLNYILGVVPLSKIPVYSERKMQCVESVYTKNYIAWIRKAQQEKN